MAIQLSERDNLIFKFIEEHQVLLEKHIAWFISCDDKPVLIRDRLRKLFYLDYLLCERHGGKLPWWTTPTKPLVYMLSPMSRQLTKSQESEIDLSNCEAQRHLLEVANLRMLFLMDQKEALISDFCWTTNRKADVTDAGVDATVTFKRNGTTHRVGIVNHPTKTAQEIAACIESSISSGTIDSGWIVSRDDGHQSAMQKALAATTVASKVAFTTHQEVYKSGIVKAKWQSANGHFASVVAENVSERVSWVPSALTPAQAF
jgi:hypothetical protein